MSKQPAICSSNIVGGESAVGHTVYIVELEFSVLVGIHFAPFAFDPLPAISAAKKRASQLRGSIQSGHERCLLFVDTVKILFPAPGSGS